MTNIIVSPFASKWKLLSWIHYECHGGHKRQRQSNVEIWLDSGLFWALNQHQHFPKDHLGLNPPLPWMAPTRNVQADIFISSTESTHTQSSCHPHEYLCIYPSPRDSPTALHCLPVLRISINVWAPPAGCNGKSIYLKRLRCAVTPLSLSPTPVYSMLSHPPKILSCLFCPPWSDIHFEQTLVFLSMAVSNDNPDAMWVGGWLARLMECIWQSALKGCCRLLCWLMWIAYLRFPFKNQKQGTSYATNEAKGMKKVSQHFSWVFKR